MTSDMHFIRSIASQEIIDYLHTSPVKDKRVNLNFQRPQVAPEAELVLKDKNVKEMTSMLSWKDVKVTREQAEQFSHSAHEGEIAQLLDLDIPEQKDLKVGENVLFAGELYAINIYVSNNYLLINGTLDNDSTSIAQWKQDRFEMLTALSAKEVKIYEAAVAKVDEIAKLIASGLNKLPNFQGTLYRGDALPSSELPEWREGKIIITNKFLSCSTSASVSESFAQDNAIDYMKDKKVEYKPTLFVIDSKTSKDISPYLETDEEERLYLPNQALRTVGVDETTVPGLAIILLEEI